MTLFIFITFSSKVIWQSYSKVARDLGIHWFKKIQAVGSSSVHTQDGGDLSIHCGRNYFLHAGTIWVFLVASDWLTKRQKSCILSGMEGQNDLAIKIWAQMRKLNTFCLSSKRLLWNTEIDKEAEQVLICSDYIVPDPLECLTNLTESINWKFIRILNFVWNKGSSPLLVVLQRTLCVCLV